jgi:hypothetical protein
VSSGGEANANKDIFDLSGELKYIQHLVTARRTTSLLRGIPIKPPYDEPPK